MLAEFLQFLFSGVTVGAAYALVALGFSIIYNASYVINFAQGEFVMLGGMATVALISAGLPMPIAVFLAVMITVGIGLLLEKLTIEPARDSSVVTMIIITIGASIFLRGLAQVVLDKEFHALPPFTGDEPIIILGASLLPQSIWVLVGMVVLVTIMVFFFGHTKLGKAMLASAHNPLAAQLVGINTKQILMLSFGLSAMLGAMGGVLIAPISATYYEVGIMLGLKGFCASILGGLGNFSGAILGGLIVGIAEAMGAGYISSEYKDAIAFVIILLVLFFMPSGLLGRPGTDRV
ncbi:MAG: branched-chain amino acid ABC transporter permease [Rhodospirillales bacterium]|nr:branched-chain amino acid ABC transporter permease [Rhodospirillales bacterium]